MEKDYRGLPMETYIKEAMKAENLLGMDNIFGVMEVISKELSKTD